MTVTMHITIHEGESFDMLRSEGAPEQSITASTCQMFLNAIGRSDLDGEWGDLTVDECEAVLAEHAVAIDVARNLQAARFANDVKRQVAYGTLWDAFHGDLMPRDKCWALGQAADIMEAAVRLQRGISWA